MDTLPIISGDKRMLASVPGHVWIQYGPKGYLRFIPHFVYRHFDNEGNALYVGCTYDPRARLSQHKSRSTYWAEQIAHTKYTEHDDMEAGRAVESAEIARLQPLHNTQTGLMDRENWSQHEFVRRATALALGDRGALMNGRSAVGRLHKIYNEKFGRDLFADMGPVPEGFRRYQPDNDLSPRQLRMENPYAWLDG